MPGGQADIGIRVTLDDAAAAGLAGLTDALKQMQAAAREASQAIQSLSAALDGLNGGSAQEVASAMDAEAAAVDSLKTAEAGLAASGGEVAAAQQEVAASMQEQAQAAAGGAETATELASAQQEVVAATAEQAQAMSESTGAAQEATASTMSLEEARTQLLGTLQAELDAESVGIQMMQEIAAEEKTAAGAADELGASAQTVQERVLGASDGLTQFNLATDTLATATGPAADDIRRIQDAATGVAGEVRGLIPVLDEAGNATGAWAYASGAASEKVQGLRADGAGLVQTVSSTAQAEEEARGSTASWIDEVAGAVNEFIALGFVLQMAVAFMGQFIAQGAAIQDSLFVIAGMTGATDQQMMTWGTDIGYLDQQFGQLETDSISALSLITRGGFQAADATIVLQQAMTLADATGETLATTTQAITLALDIFHLSADQAQRVAVAFFTALSSSTLPLSDYISLLDQSGLTAKQLGISVTDLITTLGHMGQVMGGSTMTVRELQGVLDGLVSFTELTSKQIAALGKNFDMTKFQAADLSQKLHMLADLVGGPNSPDFAKFVGGAKNVALAIQIMNQEADQTPGHFQKASQAVVQHGKAWAGMAQQVDGNSKDYQSQLQAMTRAAGTTAQDAQHQTAAMKSAWQQLSDDFVTQFGPAITAVLKNLDQSLTNTGKQGSIAANLFWSPFPGLQTKLQTFFQWVADHFQQTFGKQVPSEIQNGTPAVQNATNQYTQGVSTSLSHGAIDWGKILDDFFLQTAPKIFGLGFVQVNTVTQGGVQKITYTLSTGGKSWQDVLKSALNGIVALFDWLRVVLVGASIVPDMVSAITASFSGGGARWLAVIQTAISNLVTAFSTLPGRAMTWVQSMISQVLAKLGSFASSMYSSGLNAMSQFASGIAAGAAQAVANAWSIANQVAGILAHHSPPKEGPMKDDDTWMPNMMKMFTQGIEQNIPTFRAAVSGVASGAAGGFAAVPQVARLGAASAGVAGAGNTGGNITVPLVIDGQVITQVVINRLTGQMQMNGLGRAFR